MWYGGRQGWIGEPAAPVSRQTRAVRPLAGSENQQVDRARAKMQHQDQQELHDYGGPQQHTSRVYSDETRLTQGAARPGLSDPQAAAWAMAGRHQDSPTRGPVRRYAAVQGSSSDQRGEDYRGWPLRQRLELLALDARPSGAPPTLLEAIWEAKMGLLQVPDRSCPTSAPPIQSRRELPGSLRDQQGRRRIR